jgi:hypothetical protein
MSELLQEFVDCRSQQLRVDRAAGVIRGVKLLGLRSRNGRRYQENALAEAIGLYEGAKVNVNHPKGHPLSPRDYQDRLGIIRDVQLRPGDGLFGDLHFNPKHNLSEQLMWDAEHAAQNVGLSHNVLARTSRQGDETVVEAITTVQSIDLVADPASTQGLFEQEAASAAADNAESERSPFAWDALTVEQLQLHRPDLLQELEQAQLTQLAEGRSQLDSLMAREAATQRRERISELLQEHNLPLPSKSGDSAHDLVSAHFLQTLMSAPTEEALRRLIEERSSLVRSAQRWDATRRGLRGRPVSRDQVAVAARADGGHPSNAQEFAAAICGKRMSD